MMMVQRRGDDGDDDDDDSVDGGGKYWQHDTMLIPTWLISAGRDATSNRY